MMINNGVRRVAMRSVLCLCALAAQARATPGGIPIELALDGCLDVNVAEVERVLAAELGAEVGREAAVGGDSTRTRVLTRCEPQRVVIEVTDPVSRKMLRRSFGGEQVRGPAISRLVGIAASELVLASWAELELNPKLRAEPEGEPPTAVAVTAARAQVKRRETLVPAAGTAAMASEATPAGDAGLVEPQLNRRLQAPRTLRLVGLASRHAFFSEKGAMWGGGLRIGSEPLPSSSWAADALFESGTVTLRSGSFSLESWSVGGYLFLDARMRFATLRLGAGIRAGLLAASASGSQGGSSRAVAPWGWPLAVLAVSVPITQPGPSAPGFLFELSAEASYVVVPVAPGRDAATIRDGWYSVQAGLGVIP